MIEVFSASKTRENDKLAISNGQSSLSLMLKAGKGIYYSYDFTNKKVLICCGGGNNGGDGFILALLLKEKNVDCTVLLCKDKFNKECTNLLNKARTLGINCVYYTPSFDFYPYNVIVDGILGTGFDGKLRYNVKEIILKINASNAYKISIDIPSGLNGNTGVGKTCVKADLTVTMNNLKTGLFLSDAKDFVGQIKVVNIGIPTNGAEAKLIEKSDLKKVFTNRRENSHKGNYGYVGIIGGSTEYSGAIKLSNYAYSTLKVGAGVVKLCVPSWIKDSVLPYMVESTLFPLNSIFGKLWFSKKEWKELISSVKVIGFGMGMGRSKQVIKALRFLLANYDGVLIIDADGLNALSKINSDELLNAKPQIVLTPHLKEFSRLCGYSVEEIAKNPLEIAKNYAKIYKLTLVLKGSTTIITNGQEVYLSSSGCAGLATAGSGDVLTGVIVGVNAFYNNVLQATASACYLTGLAGELAQKEKNSYSMTARDTIYHIEKVISDILN